MPTAAAQRVTALAALTLYAQPDVAPTIEATDLGAILDSTARATIWAAGASYIYGDVILPTVRNGHRYKCIVAGTSEASAANEPKWVTGQGAQITEGASDPLLTWQEDGPDFANLYNVRAAIHAAWMYKAAKEAACVSFSVDGQRVDNSDVIKHCLQMADKFGPADIG